MIGRFHFFRRSPNPLAFSSKKATCIFSISLIEVDEEIKKTDRKYSLKEHKLLFKLWSSDLSSQKMVSDIYFVSGFYV